MAILYNCHTDGDQYRITKFSSLGEVESTYLCSLTECQCPAGHLRICRHRDMLPKFLARGAVDSYWFYDYDRGGWDTGLPKGVEVFGLDDPTALHNAIADAVGEPEAKPVAKAPKIVRRI